MQSEETTKTDIFQPRFPQLTHLVRQIHDGFAKMVVFTPQADIAGDDGELLLDKAEGDRRYAANMPHLGIVVERKQCQRSQEKPRENDIFFEDED